MTNDNQRGGHFADCDIRATPARLLTGAANMVKSREGARARRRKLASPLRPERLPLFAPSRGKAPALELCGPDLGANWRLRAESRARNSVRRAGRPIGAAGGARQTGAVERKV